MIWKGYILSKQINLKGNYIKVIRQSTQETTYGGDQGFFKTNNSNSVDRKKNQFGCGVVALTDTILYLLIQTSVKANTPTGSYVNHGLISEESLKIRNKLTQEEYMTYYNKVYDFVGGVSGKFGANGFQLAVGFNRLARKNGWKLRSRWGLSASKLYHRIEEMLQKDVPVILCIPTMLRKKDKEKSITLFQNEQKVATVNAHFVVITGIVTEHQETYLQISSWGKKYFINWKEYEQLIHNVFLGTILGNILYIK